MGSGAYDNIPLPSSAKPFISISTNDYSCMGVDFIMMVAFVISKPLASGGHSLVDSVLPCECSPKSGACGKDSPCINRLLFMECNEDCPAGRFCQNKLFTKRIYAPHLDIIEAPGKGCGLRTLSLIPAGSFIMEYVGEILSPDTMASRIAKLGDHSHFYFMTLSSDQVL